MIDTYFDRADAAARFMATYQPIDRDDPRLYAGQLYASVLSRMVAEARDNVFYAVAMATLEHKEEMRHGIPVGTKHSMFTVQGRRKQGGQA